MKEPTIENHKNESGNQQQSIEAFLRASGDDNVFDIIRRLVSFAHTE